MNVFLRYALFATLAFSLVNLMPLWFISSIACWLIVVLAAYRYPHAILERVQHMSSAVGFSLGAGAGMGAIVNTLGVLVAFAVHATLLNGRPASPETRSVTETIAAIRSG